MKTIIVSLVLAVAISAYAEVSPADFSVYGYHAKVGIPQARKIKAAEESGQLVSDQSRIVGGNPVNIAAVPYQAGLVIRILFFFTSICGGSLISTTRILTAAQCYSDGVFTAQSFTVVLGSNTIFSGGHRVETTDISIHPNYNAQTALNNLAVLRIPLVPTSNLISPIALPSNWQINNNYQGWSAIISGWGLNSDGATTETGQLLHSVYVPVIANQVCAAVYGTEVVTDSVICTNGANGRGTCTGDAGGPLAVNQSGSRVLIGVTSFDAADAGCQAGLPSAYTRITSHVAWIQSQLF